MAVTPAQKTQWISAVRSGSEQLNRVLSQLADLRDIYTDLNLSTIVDGDLTGDNAGLAAADVNAALTTVNAILTEFTAARRASLNKIGHGSL